MRPLKIVPIQCMEGPMLIWPLLAEDQRGYVQKDFHKPTFQEHGLPLDLREIFYTSSKRGTIRAIHFQTVKAQGKLVRCIKGHVYDVIVDLRIGSPTYKHWKSFDLTETGPELWIPHGFGHGYLVLEDSIVSYKCDEIFFGEYDTGIRWNDPDIGIHWPICDQLSLILSEKDQNLPSLREYESSSNAFYYHAEESK